jgi:hypothetical protein
MEKSLLGKTKDLEPKMINKIMIASTALFFFVLIFFISCENQKIVWKETGEGVVVVCNPEKPVPPAGHSSRLVLKQDLVIGNQTENEECMFSDLRSVKIDDEENIYVLEWKEIKIKVFDKNGKHIRTFGTRGQGPGEMTMPVRMEMAPGNNLVIQDLTGAKLIFYSLDGRCLKEIHTGKFWDMFGFKFDSKGCIYGDTRIYGEKMTAELKKFDSDLQPISTIASFEDRRVPNVYQAFPTRFSFNVTRDDNIIWLISSRYELTVMNSEEKTIKKILRDYKPVKITDKVKERLIREEFGSRGIPSGRTFEVPSHFPPAYYFITDDEGRIFVCTLEYEEANGTYYLYYDVFDAEGRYIARFTHPRREMVFVAQKNKIYCLVRESEEGIPLVKRYSMIWE